MRMESAAAAKATASAKVRRGPPGNQWPAEGTKIRAVYDLLMASKGLPVEVNLSRMFNSNGGADGRRIQDLRDYYGLDIRKLSNGRWVLAGEWFGKTYVDYIADRIHAAERAT